jgi:glucose-6-phosphate isomerase
MRNRPVEPLEFDLLATCGPGSDLSQRLAALMPMLTQARHELLPEPSPPPLLEEYRSADGRGNRRSRLGHILATARRLADEVDRVVVVTGREAGLAARTVLDSCAHPYHNQLSRAERGGYPRIYLAPDTMDNDALQALLDLLAPPSAMASLDSRWALIMADDGTLETGVVSRVFVEELKRSVDGDGGRLARLLVSVPGPRVAGAGGLLGAGVLLPAALAGLDVVGLLSGAAATSARFADDPAETCGVLQLAGLCHLSGQTAGACRMVVWANALETAAAWYRRQRENALGAAGSGSPADLHGSRLPEKIERCSLILHVAAQRVRRDRLMIGPPPTDHGQLAKLPELTQATLAAAAAANRAAGQPAVQLRLPQVDERSVGQMMQLLEWATAVEARLPTMLVPATGCRSLAPTGQRDTDRTHDTP